jgi:hypothetical protein
MERGWGASRESRQERVLAAAAHACCDTLRDREELAIATSCTCVPGPLALPHSGGGINYILVSYAKRNSLCSPLDYVTTKAHDMIDIVGHDPTYTDNGENQGIRKIFSSNLGHDTHDPAVFPPTFLSVPSNNFRNNL